MTRHTSNDSIFHKNKFLFWERWRLVLAFRDPWISSLEIWKYWWCFQKNSIPTISFTEQHFSKNFGDFRYRNSFPFSDFDSFLKLLAFSKKCPWVNLVHTPKQMAEIEVKRKKIIFFLLKENWSLYSGQSLWIRQKITANSVLKNVSHFWQPKSLKIDGKTS